MRELTREELGQVQLHSLEWFENYCQNEGFSYQFAYGTPLGATRHQGHIPWNDGIDIKRPREDYERLCATFPAQADHSWRLSELARDPNWRLPFAELWDSRTRVVEKIDALIDPGVGVDIWPLDRVPSRGPRRSALREHLLRLLETVAMVRARPGPSAIKRLVPKLCKTLLSYTFSVSSIASCRDRLATLSSRRTSSPRDAGVFGGNYFWAVTAEAFRPENCAPFEEFLAPIAADHESVLRAKCRPTFLSPPQVSDQVTRHAFTAAWRGNSMRKPKSASVLLPSAKWRAKRLLNRDSQKHVEAMQAHRVLSKCKRRLSWMTQEFIQMSWFEQNENYGDLLSSWITGVTTRRPVHFPTQPENGLLAIGSIASMAKRGSIVWGSGSYGAERRGVFNRQAHYDVVRGPLTRAKLAVHVMGDLSGLSLLACQTSACNPGGR